MLGVFIEFFLRRMRNAFLSFSGRNEGELMFLIVEMLTSLVSLLLHNPTKVSLTNFTIFCPFRSAELERDFLVGVFTQNVARLKRFFTLSFFASNFPFISCLFYVIPLNNSSINWTK
jgi:hypothetical protein